MRLWWAVLVAMLAAVALAKPPVVLRFACQDGNDTIGAVREVVRRFEAENPGIKVQIDQVTDEFFMKMLTQYAAGVAPDLAQMHVGMYPQFAVRGALRPLDPFVERSPDLDLKRWYPNILRFFTYEGKLYGLPTDVAPFGLIFYNKDLFDKAGIPYPSDDWTWTYRPRPELRERDFVWVMQQLTRKDRNGRTTQFGFAPDWPQIYFYLLLQSRGLKLWDDDQAPTRIVANDPRTIELMEFASRTINQENWVPTWDQIATVASSSVYDEFVRGKIAMIMTFAAKIGPLRKDMARQGIDWDVTVFPAFEGQKPVTNAQGSATVMFQSTKHPQEAWRFIQFFSGEVGQRILARAGSQPAIRDLALEPGLWLPGPESPAELRKPANMRVTDQAAMTMVYDQTPEYFEDTRVNLDNTAYDILTGTRPPRETLERVTREGQTRLDAALRKMPRDPFPMREALSLAGLFVAGLLAWMWWPERKVRYSLAERKENRAAYLFLAPLLVGLIVLTLGPFLYSFLLSFSNADMIRAPLWRGSGTTRTPRRSIPSSGPRSGSRWPTPSSAFRSQPSPPLRSRSF